jgi:hypothetical protein
LTRGIDRGGQQHLGSPPADLRNSSELSQSLQGSTINERQWYNIHPAYSRNRVGLCQQQFGPVERPVGADQPGPPRSRGSRAGRWIPAEPLKPAISVKKSITPDHIVCLEDGKKFKSLKRHLRTQYSMTPEQYREKWALPADYPMVAPNYAAARSQLAKQMGLGQQRRRRK